MHLDLKPDNMMYFRDSGGEKVLKAIDFGSCQLLSITVGDRKFASYGPEHRANFCRKISEVVGTVRYNSPEIRYTKNMCEEEDSWEKSAKLSSNTHIVVIKIN
jgi:serine/threonine protein kinase